MQKHTCKICGRQFKTFHALGGHVGHHNRASNGAVPKAKSHVVRISDRTFKAITKFAADRGLVFVPFTDVMDAYIIVNEER